MCTAIAVENHKDMLSAKTHIKRLVANYVQYLELLFFSYVTVAIC